MRSVTIRCALLIVSSAKQAASVAASAWNSGGTSLVLTAPARGALTITMQTGRNIDGSEMWIENDVADRVPYKFLISLNFNFFVDSGHSVSGDVKVPEIGQPDWHTTPYIWTRSVVLHQRLYREPMAEVVKAWSMICGSTAQTNSS